MYEQCCYSDEQYVNSDEQYVNSDGTVVEQLNLSMNSKFCSLKRVKAKKKRKKRKMRDAGFSGNVESKRSLYMTLL